MKTAFEIVQLISIYSYLNHLSDFLLFEEYISEDDHLKPIPIVNAFYQYIENYHDHQEMKDRLIRALLRGSDLYGEKKNENFEEIFVNEMFDYIISSLVFEKYGNIYGFLATVAHKATTLEVESFYSEIKNTLETATFKNEYGNHSILTPLARKRIFTDLVLPLFPQTNSNLSISSFDFIYAHAGLYLTRLGRRNTVYYNNSIQNSENFSDTDTIFNEYVFTGHTIESLIFTKQIGASVLSAFALPAFCNYIFENKTLQNVNNVVFDISHWKAAYKHFIQFIIKTVDEVEKQLKIDHTFKMHIAFLQFTNRASIGRFFINIICKHFDEVERWHRLSQYLEYPDTYECIADGDHFLPNLTQLYTEYVKSIGEKYFIFALESVKDAFDSDLIKSFQNDVLVITLLAPNDDVEAGVLNRTEYLSYDLLKFDFPEKRIVEYYALIQEDYNATLIKELDNPRRFRKIIRSTIIELEKRRTPVILKSSKHELNVFWKNFSEYKRTRFESYLITLTDEQLQSEWWKEFGLSWVPLYPCLSATESVKYFTQDTLCSLDYYQFLSMISKDEDFFVKLTHRNTRSLFHSKGISPKTIFFSKFYLNAPNFEEMNSLFQEFSLHIDEPAFESTFIEKQEIVLLRDALKNIEKVFNINFVNMKRSLMNTKRIRNIFNKRINSADSEIKTELYVKSNLENFSGGYGYKFVYLEDSETPEQIAELRTDHQIKQEILVHLVSNSSENELVYVKVNKESLEKEEGQLYYVNENNEIRRNNSRFFFSGILIPRYYSRECDVDKNTTKSTPSNNCPRALLWKERQKYDDEAVESARSKLHKKNKSVNKFLFPDERRNPSQFAKQEDNLPKTQLIEDYEIANRDLYFQLRYDMSFENTTLEENEIKLRINLAYLLKERMRIENRTSLSSIINAYKDNKEYYSATFEDYYALHNFAETGYTRITGDTNEARRMKIALYKLAIRQSDGPTQEFIDFYDAKFNYTNAEGLYNMDIASYLLYKVECKSNKFINKFLVSGQKLKFRRFTSVSANESLIMKFAPNPAMGFQPILYEIKFLNSSLSAKFQLSAFNEKVLVILPGTEFEINSTEVKYIEGYSRVLKVSLIYKHTVNEKNDWYKKIMRQIAELTN